MTRYAKNLIKASSLSIALVLSVIGLDVFRKTTASLAESAFASLGEIVIGIVTMVTLVFTIVYLFVGDEA